MTNICPICGSDCNERDELIKAEREIERLRVATDQWQAIAEIVLRTAETEKTLSTVAERERCANIVEDMVRAVDGADALAAIRGS